MSDDSRPQRRPVWARLLLYSKPPRPPTHHQWSLLGLLGSTFIVNNYDVGILNLALPQIQAGLGIAESEIGPVIALVRLGVLPALLLTMIADRIGRRRLLLVTIVGFMLCTFLTAFARNTTEFIALQFAARIFIYAEEMLAIVVIAEELDAESRGWGIGVLAALGALGHGVAALVFAMVEALPFGWRALYLFGAVPMLLIAWFRRGLTETRRFETHRRARAPERGLAAVWQPVRDLLRMYPGRLLALAAALVPFFFVASPALTFQSKFLQETHGYAPGHVTLLFISGGAVSILGAVVAGRLSDRFGRKRVIVSGLVVNAAAILLFYNGRGALIPLAWMLTIFSFLGIEALFGALGSELFPTSYRSTASGARSIAAVTGMALGLLSEGWIFGAVGSHGAAISWMVAASFIAPLAVAWLLPETATRELEEIAPERGRAARHVDAES